MGEEPYKGKDKKPILEQGLRPRAVSDQEAILHCVNEVFEVVKKHKLTNEQKVKVFTTLLHLYNA